MSQQSRWPENAGLFFCLVVIAYLYWLRTQGKLP